MNKLPANLPELLKAAGLHVVEVAGWETRGRPASKGPFHPVGVLWHHTGSKGGGKKYADWLAKTGRSDLPPPLCHLSIGHDGTVYVVAAGRANHAGVAKPSGPVAGGDGNALYAGVEVQNSGTEGYPAAQWHAMVVTGVVLGRDVVRCSANAQRAHYETSVTGKWDPGDPNGPRLGNNRVLDMDKFRAAIAVASKPSTVPTRPGGHVPTVQNHVTDGRADIKAGLDLVDRGVKKLEKASESRVAVQREAKAIAKASTTGRAHFRKVPRA